MKEGLQIVEWYLISIFSILVILLNMVIDKKLRKKLDIQKSKFFDRYKRKHPIQTWGESLLMILMVAGTGYFGFMKEGSLDSEVYFLLFFIVFGSFRAAMEWMFAREKKEHIFTVTSVISCFAVLVFVLSIKM